MSRYCIAIPIHQPNLSGVERRRVSWTLRHADEGRCFFVGPEGLDQTRLRSRWPNVRFLAFDAGAFSSIATYNSWVLQPDLYRRLTDFEFVLICQTDAVLVRQLPRSDAWKFDYLGAPWVPPYRLGWNPWRKRLTGSGPALGRRELVVGNGGLSLRRTEAFSRGIAGLPKFQTFPNEDVLISYFHRRLGIRLADEETARRYFMELGAKDWKAGDAIPDVYGFHALNKHNPALEAEILGFSE